MIVEFNWGGWSIESTAAKRADDASRSAVVAVLAPILCRQISTLSGRDQ